MIKDLKAMPAGTEIKGFPLLIKTARKAFRDADGTTFQEVVFIDASGEMTGHILLEATGESTGDEPQGHHTGTAAFSLWKSKTNICIMDGVLQETDERRKEGIKLVVYSCFDAATSLSYDQSQDMQADDWKKLRQDEIKGKIRHGLCCAYVQGYTEKDGVIPEASIQRKKDILEWQDFVLTGE